MGPKGPMGPCFGSNVIAANINFTKRDLSQTFIHYTYNGEKGYFFLKRGLKGAILVTQLDHMGPCQKLSHCAMLLPTKCYKKHRENREKLP